MVRPTRQKEAKRKSKAKAFETSSNNNDFAAIQDTLKEKVNIMAELTHVNDEENKLKEWEVKLKKMKILLKDTSGMNETQHQYHAILCNMTRESHGLS